MVAMLFVAMEVGGCCHGIGGSGRKSLAENVVILNDKEETIIILLDVKRS